MDAIVVTPKIRQYAECMEAIEAALKSGESWESIAGRMGTRTANSARSMLYKTRRAIQNGQISPSPAPLPPPAPPAPPKATTLNVMQSDFPSDRDRAIRAWVVRHLDPIIRARTNGWNWQEIARAAGLEAQDADAFRDACNEAAQARDEAAQREANARHERNRRLVCEYRELCEAFGSMTLPADLLNRLDLGG